MSMTDHDTPANQEAENIAIWDPGARTKIFRLLVTWEAKLDLKRMPAPPEDKTLTCRGMDHATEIKDFLAPRNTRHLYGPPIQRYAKMAKILDIEDLNLFNFYKPVITIEAVDNAPRTLPPKLSGGKHVTATDGRPVEPAPAADRTSLSDGPPGLDVAELLGLGRVLPSGEAELEQPGDTEADDQEDPG